MGKKFSAKLAVQQTTSGPKKPKALDQRLEQQQQQAFAEGSSDGDASLDSIPSSPEHSDDELNGVAIDSQDASTDPGDGDGDPGEGDEEGEGDDSDADADLAEFDSDDDDDSLGIMDDEFDGDHLEQNQQQQRSRNNDGDEDINDGEGEGEGIDSEDDGQGMDGGDDSEDEEGEGGEHGHAGEGKQHKSGKKFSEGGKGASFAKAFAKILQRPVRGAAAKTQPGDHAAALSAEAAHAQTAQLLRGAVGDVAILAESKTHLKRQAEEAEEAAASRAAKRARIEAKKRGHMVVPRRGQDPAHDAREKGLQKLATRGVVMLFNAVAKAQRAQQDAAAAGSKAPSKAAKTTFMAQLESSKAVPIGGLPALGGVSGDKAGGVLGLLGGKKGSKAATGQQQAQQQEQGPAWKVLQESFTGLAGSGKMKDWDKQLSDSEGEAAGVAGQSDSDAGDDEGW